MSIQTVSYIKEMNDMYEKIKKKTKINKEDLSFLMIYKKTIDNSIEIEVIEDNYE